MSPKLRANVTPLNLQRRCDSLSALVPEGSSVRCSAVAGDSTAKPQESKGSARRSRSKGQARGGARGDSAKPASGGRFRVWEVKLPWQEDVGKVKHLPASARAYGTLQPADYSH